MKTVKKPTKTNKPMHPLHPRRVKATVSRHYFSYMPNKKRHRVLIWVAFLATSAIIAAQLLYPLDRALPLARINDTPVGWSNHDTMAKLINDQFDATKVKLTIGKDKSVVYPLKIAGSEPNVEAMITQLSDYPLWLRYIPFSVFWRVQVTQANVSYSSAVLKEFSTKASKELSFEPVNARLAIKDGVLLATPDVSGSQVSAVQLNEALRGTSIKLGAKNTVVVPSKRTEAAMTTSDFAAVRVRAEAALARTIHITADDQTFTPTRAVVASWLVIGTDADGNATLTVDPARVNSYLDEVNATVGTPAGQTNITIVNGRETGRTVGSLGRGISHDPLLVQISEVLVDGKGSPVMTAEFVDIQPGIIYNSKYTTTQEGLQAYVDDLSRTKNVRISIQQLNGGRWTANARADESTPSASTFKLFIALMLFDKMDKGEIHWDDPMLDTTVSGCFNRMTIASTNPCAIKWIDDWGRDNINAFVYAHGFSQGTAFTAGEAVRTTAADLTRYMIGLYDGSIVKEPYRDRLLHNLFIHPYQDGVPTGSAGIVHNKVGFLWDYVHDSAIVEHPRGTYVMTVMTKGQSYRAIANITREVERIMYP
jgi:beta-lactamase class A